MMVVSQMWFKKHAYAQEDKGYTETHESESSDQGGQSFKESDQKTGDQERSQAE